MTASAPVPSWLRPLADATVGLSAEDLWFVPPEDGSGRASAVLIAFTETPDGPGVLLIERAANMRTHAGQVAFPGGAVDASDRDRVHTALREAREEVGLEPGLVHVVAELPAIFLPPSRFVVTPVVGWWAQRQSLRPVVAAEVAQVAVVPVAELTDPAHRFRVRHPSGWIGSGFGVRGLFVWGFTAGLLDRILTLGGWARPWDETRVRDVPDAALGSAAGEVPP